MYVGDEIQMWETATNFGMVAGSEFLGTHTVK